MALPEKIGGSGDKKPGGLVVAIGVKPKGLPPRIGGPKDGEEEGPAESMSNEEAMDEACKEIMAAIEKRSDLQLKSGLKAFFYACDAEPHDEGAHNEEEGEEEG